MNEWLLDIGRNYLNRDRVVVICKVLLMIPVLLIVFGLLASKVSGDYSMIGQILQLLFDLGLAVLCIALLRVVYENNYKIPIIGYYVVVTIIKGVYLFFITSNGTKQGELFTLIFVLSFVLHIIIGIQLLKTKFAVLGKAFLLYVGGIALGGILRASEFEGLSIIVIMLSFFILIYFFYRELPTYYTK